MRTDAERLRHDIIGASHTLPRRPPSLLNEQTPDRGRRTVNETAKDGWRHKSRQKSSEPIGSAKENEAAVQALNNRRRRASDVSGLLPSAPAPRRHHSGLLDRLIQHVKGRTTVSPASSRQSSKHDVETANEAPGEDFRVFKENRSHKWSLKGKAVGRESLHKVKSWVRALPEDDEFEATIEIKTKATTDNASSREIAMQSSETVHGSGSLLETSDSILPSPTLTLPVLEALGFRQAPGMDAYTEDLVIPAYDSSEAQAKEQMAQARALERQTSSLSGSVTSEIYASNASVRTVTSQIMDPIRSFDFFVPIAVQPDNGPDLGRKKSKRGSKGKYSSQGSIGRSGSKPSSPHGSADLNPYRHPSDPLLSPTSPGISSSTSFRSLSKSIASFGSAVFNSRSNSSLPMKNNESVGTSLTGATPEFIQAIESRVPFDTKRPTRSAMPHSMSRIGLAFRSMGHDRDLSLNTALSRHDSRSSRRIGPNSLSRARKGSTENDSGFGDHGPLSPSLSLAPLSAADEKPHRSLPEDLEKKRPNSTGATLATKRSRSMDFNVDKKAQSSRAKHSERRKKYMSSHHVVETSTIYARHEPSRAFGHQLEDIEETQGKVNQYHIIKDIGSGAYGRVVLCRNEQDQRYYACKIVSKARLRKKFRWSGVRSGEGANSSDVVDTDHLSSIKREVAILKKLSKHPNINALVEVLDDGKEDNLYMIFELCEYGPVMKLHMKDSVNPFSEELARHYFRDVVLGLEYLHYKRIIHRDIKPENLLLKAGPPLGVVQIADFGISNMFEEGEEEPVVDDKNSSPLFSPPEACQTHTRQLRGFAVDIWSLGVSLYCLVHGRPPWQEESIMSLYDKIVTTPADACETLSPELQDLLSQMLKKDPDERITLQDVKKHPWITNNGTMPMMPTEENCVFEEVTPEEVENAFQPAMMFVTKASIFGGFNQRLLL
ncbi:Calcium/calmodulin-dependent protein kinase kinase 1 [Geranomyces michiganensis]|nr:Calcium/calmodulin-dependent protein kinase kinase 1 [Geranomyces michiganensis]